MKNILFAALLAQLFFACKKDSDDADDSSDGKYSFSNSEYTGTAQVGNHYIPRPLSIRFGKDNEASAFSNLNLNKSNRDVKGTITKVEEDAQGQTQVTVSWNLPGEEQFNSPQTYTISADKSTLSGGNNPLYEISSLQRVPKDVPKIEGVWTYAAQPTWWPDINGMRFNADGTTNYIRNGSVFYENPGTSPNKSPYQADGTRVHFWGMDETASPVRAVEYYGVISADGKTLYCDAFLWSYARLTSTFATIEWYGPKRVTPGLLRQ